MVFKCGQVAYSSSGDVNAAIEVAQPMLYRKQYSACGSALNRYSKIFVTQQAIDAGLGDKVPNSKHKLLPIKNTRNLTKADMVRNDYLPNIEIDPETYKVYVDGEHITCEPEEVVCLNHKYYFR